MTVDGTRVKVGAHIKYLGFHIDGAWGFEEHFARLAPRLEAVSSSLGCLLPNLGGPNGWVRRLYVGVIRSIAFYGAPVWAEKAIASRNMASRLRDALRRIIIRTSRAYRTIGHAAAGALTGLPPLELHALYFAKTYRRTRKLRDREELTLRALHRVKSEEWRVLIVNWKRYLRANPGRVADAIRPYLTEWLEVAKG